MQLTADCVTQGFHIFEVHIGLEGMPTPLLSDAALLRLTRAERQRFAALALRTVEDVMPRRGPFDELARDRLLATACAAGL